MRPRSGRTPRRNTACAPTAQFDFVCGANKPEDLAHIRRHTQGCPVIMGRRTWEAIEGMAPLPFQNVRLAVLTHRPLKADGQAGRVEGALEDVLQQLWDDGARRVYLDGGDVVRQALQRGVVDRLTLTWVPMVLGDGIRLFDTGMPMSRWTRIGVRSLPSGLVQVEYAPADSSAGAVA
mgnify:CR=1 FL=1